MPTAGRAEGGRQSRPVDDPDGLDGLLELAEAEEQAAAEAKKPLEPALAPDTADIPDPPPRTTLRERLLDSLLDPEADRQGVREPLRSFWVELPLAFGCVFETGNFITFLILVVMLLIGHAIPVAVIALPAGLLVTGYTWAFMLSIIRDTASGEDELPSLWEADFLEDMLLPLLRFAGTCGFVLIPAGAWVLGSWMIRDAVNWKIAAILAVVGTFFWPAVVLAASIGNTLRGLWPHLVIGTVLASPLAYLAVWGVLLLSGGIASITFTPAFAAVAGRLPGRAWLAIAVIHLALQVYSAIVAMRVIGLYYRHFRRRIPWSGE